MAFNFEDPPRNPPPTPLLVERIAEEIVEDLFKNGFHEEADRLVMMQGNRDLGGWCRKAVKDRIINKLRK